MKIRITNTFAYPIDPTLEEKEILRELCTITSTQYIRRKGELHGREIEVKRRYYRNGKFPSGLLPRIFAAGVTLHIVDETTTARPCKGWPLQLPPLPVSESDFSYQDEAVKVALNKGRGLLHIPTGGGKTVVMAKLMAQLAVDTLIMVPSLELLEQTARKFQQYFGEEMVTMLGGGNNWDPARPITVATQQSLYSMLRDDRDNFDQTFGHIQCLLIDECHHVNEAAGKKTAKGKRAGSGKDKKTVANSWWEVAMAMDAPVRVGVSATLNTADSPNNQFVLESATGKIIYHISTSELIQRKVLVPLTITTITRPAISCPVWKSRTYGGHFYPGAYDTNIIEAPDRNDMIAKLAAYLHNMGKKVLVLVDLVDRHGKVLHDMIPNSVFLHGTHSRIDRDDGVEQFVKDNKILISTLVKEGFDVPAIDAIINCTGGKSHKMLIQKLGRARRITGGKETALIFDFIDDDGVNKNGDPRMCLKHSLERLSIYESVPEDKVYQISMEEAERIVAKKETPVLP